MRAVALKFLSMIKLRAANSRSALLSERLEHASDAFANIRNRWCREHDAFMEVRDKVEQVAGELAATRNELKAVGSDPDMLKKKYVVKTTPWYGRLFSPYRSEPRQ